MYSKCVGHLAGAIVHMKWNDRKSEILSDLQHKIYTSLEINSKSHKSQITGTLCGERNSAHFDTF